MDYKTVEEVYTCFLQYPKIVTDTRKVEADSLFFALKGENFDAHDFVEDALKSACAYAVVNKVEFASHPRCLYVSDTLEMLQALATFHRKKMQIPFIGITGTNGKTTTKEWLRSVLSVGFRVYATQGNFNNHIGVPLTLLSIPSDTQIAIIEMGASHLGEIGELCQIARPNYGLITNIGRAHLEGFGSFEGVVQTKTDLYRWIKSIDGIVFVNADNPILKEYAKGIFQLCYGSKENIEVRGIEAKSDPFLQFCLEIKGERCQIQSHLFGIYNLENALASATIAHYLGLSLPQIKKGLEQYIPSNSRSQYQKSEYNDLIIDAYNANPSSMHASLDSFIKSFTPESACFILGDMLELGAFSEEEHQEIIDKLKSFGAQNVFLIGKYFAQSNKPEYYKSFEDVNALFDWILKNPIKGKYILLKGSHSVSLEKLIKVL